MSHGDPAVGLIGMEEIIVIGAGYAGVMAANRLAARVPEAAVTVVADRDRFVERVRLHELVAGSRAAVDAPLSAVLDRRVRVVVDRATSVAAGRVELASGSVLRAGHTLLAVGSGARGGITDWEGALEARARVAALAPGERVLVRGGGLTGIELAAELAEARPDLRVGLAASRGRLAAGIPQHRAALERSLRRLGVDLAPPPEAARTLDATGFRVPEFAADSGLPVDDEGRVLVDAALRVIGVSGIWAAGDCAAPSDGAPLRMSCAAAEPMAAHAADEIAATLRGEDPQPFDFGFAIQCLSLGRRDGLIVRVDADDRPTGGVLRGRTAAIVKELVCRAAAFAPRRLARAYRWPSGRRRGRIGA